MMTIHEAVEYLEQRISWAGLIACTDVNIVCESRCPYWDQRRCQHLLMDDVLNLLKEQKNEYENGFNDAMLGKQELMYEGTDGKWYKKDW